MTTGHSHRVDLRALTSGVLARLAPVAEACGVELESAYFAWEAWTDEAALKCVLTELIAREIRRASPPSTISVVTTPRRTVTEVRIINWGANGSPGDGGTSRASRETADLAGELSIEFTFGALLLEVQGGGVRIERSAEGSVLCVTLPRSP